MFVDEVIIDVIAGAGGDGCTAFRREKYVPLGGPYGGNGGHGSDIVFRVDEGLHTLLDLKYQKEIKGKKGANGEGKNKHGRGADPLIISVPPGTMVTDLDTGLIIADLKKNGEEQIIAKGGRGGRGNTAFKTQTNTAPNYSENGEPGEKRRIKVELKMLADVGLVGLPSVGKSTIISCVSKSKPKIAAYHFTTLTPNLGVVKASNGRSFVMADLPGLIEGASKGEGLGDKFLKHIERTKIIVHVLDMSGSEGRDPYEDFVMINKELEEWSSNLIKKKMVVVANKMDIDGASKNLEEFKKKVDKDLKVFEASAAMNKGLDKVVNYLGELLEEIKEENIYEEDMLESHVLYKFEKEEPFTITRDDDGTWAVEGDQIEKMFKMTKFTDEGIRRFTKKLYNLGIEEKLKEAGAQDGDSVRIVDFYFDYKE
ncbi:MAG: GTPase ObgE [Bacilli bacterium]|nr:GTPase ObgE [Bacilli bacterium]